MNYKEIKSLRVDPIERNAFLWFALGDKEITPLITMVCPASGFRISVSREGWPFFKTSM